jgi:mono/diheme cytochrome c family protein
MPSLEQGFAARSAGPLLGGLVAALGLLAQAASAQDSPDSQRGRAVYEHWCAPCHAAGPGHPGTQSLQIKYNGSPSAVLLERTDLAPEAVKVFVRQGVLSMAPFRKTEIPDAELDDVAAYLAKK